MNDPKAVFHPPSAMSISGYRCCGDEFIFKYDIEVVHTSEAHILVPMCLVDGRYFGLVFVDTNDTSVYRPKNTRRYTNGSLSEHEITADELVRISGVSELVEGGAIFKRVRGG